MVEQISGTERQVGYPVSPDDFTEGLLIVIAV